MKTLSTHLATGALAVAGILGSLGAAQAATISGGSFAFGQATTEIDQTGTLGKFNPALGTLTSVSFSISGAFTQSFTASNSAAQAQSNVRVQTATDLLFSLIGGPALSPDTLSFGANTGFLNYAIGETKSFGPFTDSDSQTITFTGAALAFFTGAGTFDVNCISLSSVTVTGGGGNIDSTQNTTAGCGASVVYTFNEVPPPVTGVPEPGTVLGLLAVAGTGVIARRKI
jgi:hypothetical protein